MDIYNLIIETTRKCNMMCWHCLRGEPQNKNIPVKYIDHLFRNIWNGNISVLTITGGEPSMNVKSIRSIIYFAKIYRVIIENFYIATNGLKATKNFINAIRELYDYCDDNEISQVHWSNDNYHHHDDGVISRLSELEFAGPKFDKDRVTYPVLRQGRAEVHGEKEVSAPDIEFNEEGIQEGEIYLNCNGNIINGCNWSYKSQNRKEHIICKVENFSLRAIEEYCLIYQKEDDNKN